MPKLTASLTELNQKLVRYYWLSWIDLTQTLKGKPKELLYNLRGRNKAQSVSQLKIAFPNTACLGQKDSSF